MAWNLRIETELLKLAGDFEIEAKKLDAANRCANLQGAAGEMERTHFALRANKSSSEFNQKS
jgi:hypothetical protein